jgi:hypothetical protein
MDSRGKVATLGQGLKERTTMNRLLVCLGGTGQLVLHYYLQWYLLGIERGPLRALIFDPDELMPSLQYGKRFFQAASHNGKLLGKEPAPWIEHQRLDEVLGAGTTADALTGGPGPSLDHPVRAFFGQNALNAPLRRGLFSMPALAPMQGLRQRAAAGGR